MIILLLVCLLAPAYQQPKAGTLKQIDPQKLKQQAQELSDAMIEGDYARAAERIKVREGTLVGEAFMIAISADGGRSWTFVDAGGRPMNKDQLRTLIGPVADRLQLPEIKPPVLHPGEDE